MRRKACLTGAMCTVWVASYRLSDCRLTTSNYSRQIGLTQKPDEGRSRQRIGGNVMLYAVTCVALVNIEQVIYDLLFLFFCSYFYIYQRWEKQNKKKSWTFDVPVEATLTGGWLSSAFEREAPIWFVDECLIHNMAVVTLVTVLFWPWMSWR